jgi:TRAP-type mannitol/chloroaromatic compound transport system permease small subunit
MQEDQRQDIAGHTPLLSPLIVFMGAASALCVLAMAVIVNVDVFGRGLFNRPLRGALEMTEIAVVAVVYLALAHCIATGRMTRSDGLLNLLDTRRPFVSATLRAFFNLAGMGFLLIIAYGQYPRLMDAWEFGYYKGNPGVFTIARWPLDAILLLGVLIGAIQFLLLSLRNLMRVWKR